MSSSVYAAIPIMLLLAIVQTAVLPFFPIFGLTPQLPFLVALAWALLRGEDEGVLWAFIAGFFLDLFSIIPVGVTSLSYMIGIFAIIWIQRAFSSSRFFLTIILAILSTLISLLVYIFLLRIFGYMNDFAIATSLPTVSLLHGGLILPIYWVMYRIDRLIRPRRVQI